jgi:hypothetical protein
MTTRAVVAIVERLKAKRKRPTAKLKFLAAVGEITTALALPSEIGTMLLYGLVASGNVRAFNAAGEVMEEDECTIAELIRNPEVEPNDIRHWLAQWVPRVGRDAVIERLARETRLRGKRLYNKVRDECGGWIVTGGERRPGDGFSDKTIQRIINGLGRK